MNASELLDRLEKGASIPSMLLLKGDEPYLESEIQGALKRAGFDVENVDWRERGPTSEIEGLCLSSSLFSPRRAVWNRRVGAVSKWNSEDEARWASVSRVADGDQLLVVLQVPADKRIKWKHLGELTELVLEVPAAQRLSWVKRMNERRGAKLDADRLSFLASLESDLTQVDSFVELWALGGDLWASRALGYGEVAVSAAGLPGSSNPAFEWVDALISANVSRALRLLEKLETDGAEPLQLLALASKSVRILATLEDGRVPEDQPDFLIGKIRQSLRALPAGQRGRGRRLLVECAELDRKLKSSAQDPWALLRRLGS